MAFEWLEDASGPGGDCIAGSARANEASSACPGLLLPKVGANASLCCIAESCRCARNAAPLASLGSAACGARVMPSRLAMLCNAHRKKCFTVISHCRGGVKLLHDRAAQWLDVLYLMQAFIIAIGCC